MAVLEGLRTDSALERYQEYQACYFLHFTTRRRRVKRPSPMMEQDIIGTPS